MNIVPRLKLQSIPSLPPPTPHTQRCYSSQNCLPDLRRLLGRHPKADDFKTLAVIGRGAYAMVTLCRHKVTNELFALKQMALLDLAKKSKKSLVCQEIKLLYRANSAMVPKLYFAWQDDVFLYLLMEFTAGGDLMKHLADRRLFSEPDCRQLMSELILCLQYVHNDLQCVHRDIKPENILIDSDGHLKLADFGLSRYVGSPSSLGLPVAPHTSRSQYPPLRKYNPPTRAETHRSVLGAEPLAFYSFLNPSRHVPSNGAAESSTVKFEESQYRSLAAGRQDYNRNPERHSNVLFCPPHHERLHSTAGTTEYMAPEIYRQATRSQEKRQGWRRDSDQGYTRSVDWWSAGVVMFDLLFGSLPFTGEKKVKTETIESILHWRQHLRVLPSKIRISAKCENFLRRLLADPEERISTAEEAMAHPWFAETDWENLRQQRGPLVVDKSNFGLRNFDRLKIRQFEKWEMKKKSSQSGFLLHFFRLDIPLPPFCPQTPEFQSKSLALPSRQSRPAEVFPSVSLDSSRVHRPSQFLACGYQKSNKPQKPETGYDMGSITARPELLSWRNDKTATVPTAKRLVNFKLPIIEKIKQQQNSYNVSDGLLSWRDANPLTVGRGTQRKPDVTNSRMQHVPQMHEARGRDLSWRNRNSAKQKSIPIEHIENSSNAGKSREPKTFCHPNPDAWTGPKQLVTSTRALLRIMEHHPSREKRMKGIALEIAEHMQRETRVEDQKNKARRLYQDSVIDRVQLSRGKKTAGYELKQQEDLVALQTYEQNQHPSIDSQETKPSLSSSHPSYESFFSSQESSEEV